MSTIMPIAAPIELNECLWQAWLVKNRERDLKSATSRLRLLELVLVIGIVGAILLRIY